MKEHVLVVRIRDKFDELYWEANPSLEQLTRDMQELIDDGIGTDEGEPNIIVEVTAHTAKEAA